MEAIKNIGKKALLVSGLIAVLGGCVVNQEERSTDKQHYVDLNNDSKKEIVYVKYEGRGLGDPVWGLYEAGETPRKLFTLKGTDNFRFEDMDGYGFPEIIFEVYAGRGMGDPVWDVYSVKNNNGNFGEPQKIARVNKN